MAEKRPGETVTIVQEQKDPEGLVMSDITANWYGFDNMTANAMSIELVKAVTELTEKFATDMAGVDNIHEAALDASKGRKGGPR